MSRRDRKLNIKKRRLVSKQATERRAEYTEKIFQLEIISMNQPAIKENRSVPLSEKKNTLRQFFKKIG